MSRAYKMVVEFKNIELAEVKKVVCGKFHWEEIYSNKALLECEGALCGGLGEEKAHQQIYNCIKKKFPKAKINTSWTCMEYLPRNEFGDVI